MSAECECCGESFRPRDEELYCRACVKAGDVVECEECDELFAPASDDQVMCESCAELLDEEDEEDDDEDDEDAIPVATPDYRQQLRDATSAAIDAEGMSAAEQYVMQMMHWLKRKSGLEYDPAVPAMPSAFIDAARAVLGDDGPEVAEAIVLPLLPGLERRPEGTQGDPWGYLARAGQRS